MSKYQIAIDLLYRIDASKNDMCCLCFKKINEGFLNIDDVVVCKLNSGTQELELLKILVFVLGDEVIPTFPDLNCVCRECGTAAIQSYVFKMNCIKNIEEVASTIHKLSSNINITTTEDIESFESLLLHVKQSGELVLYYDTRTWKPSAVAETFKFLTDDRPRDFSTIFFKTSEMMLDPESKQYTCKLCSKKFPAAGPLRVHFFANHFKKDFHCIYCTKSFGTCGLLNSHIKQSHSTVKLQKTVKKMMCELCGRCYKKQKGFERHKSQNTCNVPSKSKDNIFICDYCGRQHRFKHHLVYHIRFDHLDQAGFSCKWCQKKCYNASSLKVHILKHTREKKFQCEVCSGRFVTRQSLMNHKRLHTGERPYPCMHCPQSFLSASRRKEHVERNHMNATFDCSMCDAKYNARRSLLKHIKKHSEYLYPIKTEPSLPTMGF